MPCGRVHWRQHRPGTGAPPGKQGIPGLSHKAVSFLLSQKCSPLPTGNSWNPPPGILHSPRRYQTQVRCLGAAADLFLILTSLHAEQGRCQHPLGRGWGSPPGGLCRCPASRGSCPAGLHLLASGKAVSWVPKPHLLHLLPKLQTTSDFVSFPLAPAVTIPNKIYLYGTLTTTFHTNILFFQRRCPAVAKHLSISLSVTERPLPP